MTGSPYMPPDVEPIDPVPERERAPVWAWVVALVLAATVPALMVWEFAR